MIEGNFAYSFLLGVMAAVNPCGFVLLPTYLIYYLGTELHNITSSRTATLRRGLSVGIAVSSGFVSLFLVVGIISRAFTTVIQENAKYVSLVVGLALILMGLRMFTGWKPTIVQPNLSMKKERTTRNMFLFGIVYAVASLSCTIGFLTSVILGSVGRHGYVSGVISVVLYGLGMGLLVTTLTVALAFARNGLVSTLRRSFKWFDTISALFVTLTGVYLSWYWYVAITDRGSDGLVSRVEKWQTNTAVFLQGIGAIWLAIIFSAVIGCALLYMRLPHREKVPSDI